MLKYWAFALFQMRVFKNLDTDRISEVIFSICKMFRIPTDIINEDQLIQQKFEDTVDLITKGLSLDSSHETQP